MANVSRQVSIFINGKEVEGTIKGIAAAQSKVNNELKRMAIGTDEYENKVKDLQKLNTVIREHNEKLRGVKQGWESTKGGLDKYVGVAAGAFTVSAIVEAGKALFATGSQMDALAKKAKTVFGEALPQITKEAEKNAKAMGLTTSQYISAASAAQDLLVPMGFQRKEAADVSAQIVNLSGALSEWTGGQVDSKRVSEILTKALLGEREELKSLGISISEADVKARLAADGHDKLTGAALEQAKASATLSLILAKSTDAQAQFADGAGSSVRRQAEAAAKYEEIAEKLSTLLLPVFERLLALGGGVLDFFGSMVDGLDSLVNPAESASAAFDSQTEKVADLEKNISPLLTRYDELSTKANLSAKEQIELQSTIDKVAESIPSAVTQFDAYGKALGLNTDAARNFIEVEKARLVFVNENAIRQNEDLLKSTQQKVLDTQKVISSVQKSLKDFSSTVTQDATATAGSVIAQKAEDLKTYQNLITGINAEIDRLKGNNLKIPENTKGGVTPNSGGKDDKAAKKAAEDAANEAAFIKRFAEVKEAMDNARAVLGADAEKFKQTALDNQLAILDGYIETTEQKKLIDLNYEEEKAAAAEEIRVSLLDDRSIEIEALQEHYNQLLFIAETYGLDTAALKEKQAKDQAAIEKKYAAQILSEQQKAQTERLEALQSAFTAFGDFSTAIFELIGQEGEKSTKFQKFVTLAKIAFDTASAISSLVAASSANPANAVTFGAAGIAQYVTGFARIIANIAQAKKILSSAPEVKQKAEGRYLVTGADDGRTYNAAMIGAPGTGMLPGFPVLFQSNATNAPVLASERGAEYFVASRDLRNPVVANYVRMIDNVVSSTRGRVAQFADGGTNSTTPPQTTAAPAGFDAAIIQRNTQVLEALLSVLKGGVIAVVPDGTVLDIQDRYRKINEGSGGFFENSI